MPDLAKIAQQDVADFYAAYIELLTELAGESIVEAMRQEIDFRVKMGAELAEALAEHYEHTKRKYNI